MHSLPFFLSSQCKMTKLTGSAPYTYTRQAKRKEIRSSLIWWLHIYLIIVLGSYTYICTYMYVWVTMLMIHNRWEVRVWWYSSSHSTFLSFLYYERQATVTRNEKKRTTISRKKIEKNIVSPSPPIIIIIIAIIQPLSHLSLFFVQYNILFLLKRKRREKARNLSVVIYMYAYKKKQPQMSPMER